MAATDSSILRFIRRTLIFASVVIMPLIIWYVFADPFKVMNYYEEYYENPATGNPRIGLNKGMISVNTYNSNLSRGEMYNAFIFGSSISCFFNAGEWRQLIDSRDSSISAINPFHFDSSGETPISMARKVEFLHRSGASIDYALIVLDPIILGYQYNDSPFGIDPPEFYPGLRHFAKYHYTFFRAATNADFMKSFIAAKISGKAENIGHNPIFEVQPIIHDQLTNEEKLPQWDSLISANPTQFYTDHPLLPPAVEVKQGPAVITEEKRRAFTRIAAILNEQKTDYQIIISPNRRGVAVSSEDRLTLQKIFSPSRIHDFSARFARDLQADTLLYDNTHYRPSFASRMMHAVYADDQECPGGSQE